MSANYLSVLVKGLPDPLTYRAPENLSDTKTGYEVNVEVRNRIERGWVIDILTEEEANSGNKTPAPDKNIINQGNLFSESQIKNKSVIKPILASHPAFNPDDLPFFKWISDYYGTSLSEVFENAVPKRLEARNRKILKINQIPESEIKAFLEKTKTKAKAQFELISMIMECKNPIYHDSLPDERLRRSAKSLESKGIISITEFVSEPKASEPVPGPTLNPDQQNAVETLVNATTKEEFSSYLLMGITGSGKTEVYLRTISEVLANGGRALLIVPEIALTPQILGRFQERLGVPVSVLHSKIGNSAKWQAWQDIIDNKVSLAIGARSAIFAPIRNLSLIIVDEEHEGSFKQGEGLRYHGRDLAIMKAKFHKCTVLLGSATPSFETLQNVIKKNTSLLELKERAGNAVLPEISLIDMKNFKRSEMPSERISPPLYNAIKSTLEKGEQIIIFYNKRGFASFLQCDTCGNTLGCPQCSVTLTYYDYKKRLSCHYCGYTMDAPELCNKCHDTKLVLIDQEDKTGSKTKKQKGNLIPRGSGTEKIHEEIEKLFPDIPVVRLDRESTTQKMAMEEILKTMHDGTARILVGTQMIAKGHDLPNVTLVGFIDADVGLHFPDFRASERIFQLIVQAAGRAGRGNIPGQVIIQTREPHHPTIVAATTNRFKAFARYELEFRKSLSYPPFGRLARLIISSQNREEAFLGSKRTAEYLGSISSNENQNSLAPWKILGPSIAPIEKLRGRYRWHILIKSESAKTLSTIARHLNQWKRHQKDLKDFRLTVDIDPIDML
ncbi:MAG TPA: primosomal protein N' [Oligoflexia bacterium]|nr:primosomal protein N' [Oligoflexia bacterium]HMP49344.1 primosomal protein N' [Oligoflexia bacterium]